MKSRPFFNRMYPHYESRTGVLRLGEQVKTIELDDEDGAIHSLVQLLDGTRTIEQVYDDLHKSFPYLTLEEIGDAIHELDRLGFLYDQKDEENAPLTPIQRERFKGNLNYFSHFADMKTSPSEYQNRLLECKVTILGMGAFGCSVLFNLAGLGVRNVRIVDFDTVARSNLNRQMLFNENDLGRLKVEVAKEFMSKFYSDMEIEAIPEQIQSMEDVEQYIAGSDLVITAADQPFFVIGGWMNKACVKLGIPFIGGGISSRGGQVNTILPGVSGCFDCSHYKHGEEAPTFPAILERLIDSNFITPNMAVAPHLQIVTGMVANQAMKFLTGVSELETGQIHINFMTYEITKNDIERQADHCPTCGNGTGEQPIFKVLSKPEFTLRPMYER